MASSIPPNYIVGLGTRSRRRSPVSLIALVTYLSASFNSISVNGAPVVERTAAIFDNGTTQIVGDTASIAKLFEAIDDAQSAPQFGEGTYTSAFSSAGNHPTHIHITRIP